MAAFSQSRTVLFQEIDAAGIVFYARFFEWFHDAWISFLSARGIDLAHLLSGESWGMPLVHAEADYRAPLSFGAPLTVEIDGVALGDTSLTVTYTVRSGGKTCAVGRTVHAFIVCKTFQSCAIPDEVRRALSS